GFEYKDVTMSLLRIGHSLARSQAAKCSRLVDKIGGNRRAFSAAVVLVASLVPNLAWAQAFVPGSGQRLTQVGDDFEDPKWTYNLNMPKSSSENDKQERLPAGRAANDRWAEGLMRGQPDVIKRVPTPLGGIPGSEGSMLIMSLYTGVPGEF